MEPPTPRVEIYTTDVCPYCTAVKALFDSIGTSYREIDVSNRPDTRAWLLEKTGQRTVPQVFIDGVACGGYSDIQALQKAGKLNSLLGRT